ncbi:MAG TPA: leucyl aminopeptidase, partial [Desulfosalsimonadaceae bacterium]|nr:leucyl aminopeptidase [Desulfosalsimonadaceae bacterium]
MLEITSTEIRSLAADLLLIAAAEDGPLYEDPAARGLIAAAQPYSELTGKSGDELVLHRPAAAGAVRVMFAGLGKAAEITPEDLRKAAGKAVKKAVHLGLKELVMAAPDADKLPFDAETAVSALLEGAFLGNHVFDHYKEKKDKQPVQKVVLAADAETAEACSRIPSRVQAVCKGTLLAREWVNIPPNDKRPDRFVRSITKAADKEALTVTVLDEQALKKNKMGGIVAAGAGSRSRSRMVILDYSPKKAKKTCALIGKGVTFDSGGINIKTGPTLEDMKMDMAGGACVAAALIAASRLKPDFRVVGVIPVVENMPSGDAARPGDIIRSFAGKTVEIGNTDAEGRLILIDALAYAEKMFAPDVMMDIATLTGACIMALGEKIAGVFANDQKLSDAVVSAGESVYERCWPMPMPEDYRELLKSDFADIRNIGSSRWGGAIAAALFLSEFVADTRWAHIDIAGPAYAKKGSDY